MSAHLPALVVIAPLLAAVVVPLLGRRSPGAAHAVTLAALGFVLAASSFLLSVVVANGVWRYAFAGWAPPWGIEYVLDPLSAGMMVLVSFLALAHRFTPGPTSLQATHSESEFSIRSIFC